MTVNVFAVPVFFICFRECLETVIIVSVLLAWLKQTIGPERDPHVYKKLVRQVWWGVGLGLAICIIVGGGMIGAFYGFGKNHFAATEDIWEGSFGLLATIIITVVGAALLRVSKLQDKWRVKLARALEKNDQTAKGSTASRFKLWCQKYAMFLLPFITVLREGLEAVVFIGGVGLSLPATAFPLAVVCGILAGVLVGYLIYRGGNSTKLQIFLIISTCFLYLVAAGLFSKSVWFFENHAWNKLVGGDASETGSGPGSYNIHNSVWHVNCCNPQINGGGGWGIFNAIFGWTNSATYGSVIAYNLYWVLIMAGFLAMRYFEQTGHWPLMKAKAEADDELTDSDNSRSGSGVADPTFEKKDAPESTAAFTKVREVGV
ncbi:high-affinity iron permease [Recurvomyces mirabilis]|uniref:High-affinity iron permease n=1 Tax=Recurvomyces mirabilis TaxID=574656 RepID=A0AAE0TPG4_9PEZI|nr:high-affinity iron permease [Recurvomyces mirabilis]KAK5160947.1 high-affinity iron permease [Recurvomyces mirabilis]